MKKIIVVVLMVLVAIGASAEDWLSVDFAFQMGWILQGGINFYEPDPIYFKLSPNAFDIVFKIDAKLFDVIKIGGDCTTFFSLCNDKLSSSPIVFWPTGMTYLVYCGIEPFKGFSIVYEHSCSHPVAANFPGYNGDFILDSYYDRIYLEIKGKIKLFDQS